MVDLGEVIQTMDNGLTQRDGGVAAAITYRNFASSCWDRGKVVVTTRESLDGGATRAPNLELRGESLGDQGWLCLAMPMFLRRYLVDGIVRICSDWFFRVKT